MRLHVLSGLPGSGKTTRCMQLARETGAAVVARDAVRDSMVNVHDESVISLVLTGMVEFLLSSGHDVIVDSWNLQQWDREQWTCMSESVGAELVWEHLATPVELCIERDARRPRSIGAAAVLAAAAAPEHAEGLAA